jgi:hypothetical protein
LNGGACCAILHRAAQIRAVFQKTMRHVTGRRSLGEAPEL